MSTINTNAQNALMKRYAKPDLGRILIPSNMKIIKEEMDMKYYDPSGELSKNDDQSKTITFSYDGSMSETYATIVITTYIQHPGTYERLNSWTLSPKELQQFDGQAKAANEYPNYQGVDRLITWNGSSVTTVNGYKALKTSYVRQFRNNPFVYVESYIFFNYDRLHTLTLSYRQKDDIIWKPIYAKVLSSFEINN